jgi:hypothetical protein
VSAWGGLGGMAFIKRHFMVYVFSVSVLTKDYRYLKETCSVLLTWALRVMTDIEGPMN